MLQFLEHLLCGGRLLQEVGGSLSTILFPLIAAGIERANQVEAGCTKAQPASGRHGGVGKVLS